MTVSAPLGTRLPCLPLRSPSHDRVPSSPHLPATHGTVVALPQLPAAGRWISGSGGPSHVPFTSRRLPSVRGSQGGGGWGAVSGSLARGGCAAAKWMGGGGCSREGEGGARRIFFLFRKGCNLIGGHSCVNRGIEEFCVGLMELTLHEWPPSPPPSEMGHFPHVSENMTTSPAKSEPKAGNGRPARGKLHFFSPLSCEILFLPSWPIQPSSSSCPPPPPLYLLPPLWPSWLKTSSKPRCLTCQKRPPSSGKSQKQNKPATAGRVRGQQLLVHRLLAGPSDWCKGQ